LLKRDSVESTGDSPWLDRQRSPFFKCPNCDAQVVKVEALPEASDREIKCLVCGEPLAAREGEFVLKYFLLRTAARKKTSQRRPLSV
jgi:ribosomal protein S27E